MTITSSALSSYSSCVQISRSLLKYVFVTAEHDYLMLSSLSNDTLGLIHLCTKPVPLASGNVALMIAKLICFLIHACEYKELSQGENTVSVTVYGY